MPLYDFKCLNGHTQEEFSTVSDKNALSVICKKCNESMGQIICASQPMLYFEEGRGRWMNNLGPEPVLVKSHKELERKMKERGLEFAGSRRGTKGSWI